MRPSVGWWLKHYQNDVERNMVGKSLFIFLTQSDRGIGAGQNSLHDYRYRILNPLIHLSLDVNVHASDLYPWWPNDHSSLPLIHGELKANGLMNFDSTTHLSTPLVLLMVAWAYGWSWNWNWGKVRILVRLLHILGADWQQYRSQLKFEKYLLSLVRRRGDTGILSFIIYARLFGQIGSVCGDPWDTNYVTSIDSAINPFDSKI